ncbi:class I SAM-dependent methyltransferase [Lysinibacillus sp. NPDC097214]|uniref:class I SAM-dependent methyltransferase n=1 Tax=Lysinibacillus sp. NPDC097214 TaxID=3390584 RepID=UPI003D043B68
MKCSLCGSDKIKMRFERVRDRSDIQVLECEQCTLVFLSSFEHISNEFYEESGMMNGKVDIKNYRQQSIVDDRRRFNDLKNKIIGKKVLDFGCGAGGFLHLGNELCEEIHGVELDKALNKIINGEGIKCYSNIDELEEKYDVITLFHVVEHLVNPTETLGKLKKYLKPNGILVIEVPNADDALLTLFNNEAFASFTYWSCHLYLYNEFTLKSLLKNAGYSVKAVKQIQRYPLSNHLYWLSKGMPGGHNHFGILDNPLLRQSYESSLAALGKCDTIIGEFQVID